MGSGNNTTCDTSAAAGVAPREGRRFMVKWLGGVGAALVAVGYGVYCLVSGHAILPGESSPLGGGLDLDLYGSSAVALAIAYIAIGVLIHLQLFWVSYPRLHLLCTLLTVVMLVVLLGGVGYTIWHVVAWGY